MLKEYGIPLCRALHAADADRCQYPPTISDVIEVRGLDNLGSAHSILGAVIDTDRLSIRNGLKPVTLPDPGTPIKVQAVPLTAWKGDTVLGRTIGKVIPVPGTGDLAKEKIRLIAALVKALGTIPRAVGTRPSGDQSERSRTDNDKNAGQQDVYFGMPW